MFYFLLIVVLLQHTVNTEEANEKSLDQMYEDLKSSQSSCSLLDKNTEEHFQKLCKDRKSPDKMDQFEFDFLPYLCYTVLHNLRSACSHSQQNFTKFVPQEDASQFCTKPPSIEIQDNCTDWLEDQNKAHWDCALVSKVVAKILSNKTCHDYCVKEDKIDPLCQDLVRSSVILSELSHRQQPAAPLTMTPPGLTKGSTAQQKKVENTENTEKEDKGKEEKKEGTMTSSAIKETSPIIKTESEPKEIEGEGKDNNGKEENIEAREEQKVTQVEEKSAETAAEEEIEKIVPATPAVPETNPPKDKIEAKSEKESKPQQEEQKTSGVISENANIVAQSNFFSYFILLSIVAILAYLVFHNKQKILALILEGRRQQGSRRRSGGREYRKLDNSLEDTMEAGREANLRQVIY